MKLLTFDMMMMCIGLFANLLWAGYGVSWIRKEYQDGTWRFASISTVFFTFFFVLSFLAGATLVEKIFEP